MLQIIIFILLLSLALNYITYDSGLFQDFDWFGSSGFACMNSFTKTSTITFSGQFENTPQVITTLEFIDLTTASTQLEFQITSITKQTFSVMAYCGFNRVTTIQIRWFAIDDQRIEVFNNFNMINPDDKTFQIKNRNAQSGFVVMTSIHYIGPIDFLLSMSQITMQQVTVSITKVAGKFTNLKQIGYQLIVAVDEAFVNLGLQSVTGAFNSGILPIQPNRWFAIAIQGFNYSNSKNIRVKAIFTNTPTTISYTWGTWYDIETPNTHSQIWIAYQFVNSYKALECFTIRTSRKYIQDLTNLPKFSLKFDIVNQIYNTIGNYNYILDKSITPFIMSIEIKCQADMKIQAEFNKCNACNTQKFHVFKYNCFNQMNYVGFFPKFKQAFQQYNHLKINMQETSLEIIQVLYDQKIIEQTIVKIELFTQ
ncbi:unnamed protein product [Paramecium sonneborni]|uniref:H-type lectin domain-containing protein n=1 Tax=Paramecium sonneborni TaxID=65129 RepID=A0A8S1PV96_9CILI|nr:unnamed protein product [Paramecium sonneborni]